MTTLLVTFTQEGFHSWKGAPKRRSYLAEKHRHNFHFRVEIQCNHADREIELHDLLNQCKTYLWMGFGRGEDTHSLDFEHWSCEMLAEFLAAKLQESLPGRWVAAECWEDGEVGARVEEGEDTALLDWLSDKLAYIMLSGPPMTTLPNKGKGWQGGELRDAIRAAIAEEKTR